MTVDHGGFPMLLTAKDVAVQLAVSPSTVRRLVQDGQLGHTMVGHQIRFRQEHVDAYVTANEQLATKHRHERQVRVQRPLTDVQERYPHLAPPGRRNEGDDRITA